ncbi:MAG: helix-turn-helix transcriptional regulator [Clostridia bacterium]|nr:helix-turn-helix transcriptional regulator [Clostridia bacterium]
MSVGSNIKFLRMMKGLSQEELAERVNVTKSMISQIERGTKNLTMELSVELARELGCDIRDFVK